MCVPTVGVAVEELTAALKELNRKADAVNLRRIEIHQARQLKDVDIASLEGQIASLKEDLQKNQDVQKLQRYAGRVGALTPDRCPRSEEHTSELQSLMRISY